MSLRVVKRADRPVAARFRWTVLGLATLMQLAVSADSGGDRSGTRPFAGPHEGRTGPADVSDLGRDADRDVAVRDAGRSPRRAFDAPDRRCPAGRVPHPGVAGLNLPAA